MSKTDETKKETPDNTKPFGKVDRKRLTSLENQIRELNAYNKDLVNSNQFLFGTLMKLDIFSFDPKEKTYTMNFDNRIDFLAGKKRVIEKPVKKTNPVKVTIDGKTMDAKLNEMKEIVKYDPNKPIDIEVVKNGKPEDNNKPVQ